ncbi:EndoU domain-containing protein [Glycomyces harbinensis]|uniref:EndoU nuclease n=1 Tax=Glycomyces harbinensis TaxID=58114 RepID=A0A1G6SBL5_9ACTN|nr:EndoU domain-containing protein [Glycomyces harbinensis]SDD14292.1 EndoU nuclease [Glycomyces harbinensis]
MASIGDVAAVLRTAITTAEQAAANLRAADDRLESTLTPLQAGLDGASNPDALDGLASLGAAREGLAEALDALEAGNDRLGEYIASIAGSGAENTRSGTRPPEPPSFGSSGYPVGRPHRIGWSDLHHVVNGDDDNPEKGGHAFGTGRPGKSEFPEGWDDEDISEALAAVAERPSKVNPDLTGRNFIAEGIHRGVTVQAVVRPDGSIEAGWPVKGPGVKRNPRRR